METLNQDVLVRAIGDATTEVFSTMLGLSAEAGASYHEENPPGPAEGVVSLIGLAGPWAGTGSVSCSGPFACRLSSQLLMSEFSAVDSEVLDAVAELTNMIVGNVKTVLEVDLGPMGLSIPTVVFGKNFITRSGGNGRWTVVPFHCEGERVEVRICLAPNRKDHASHPGFSHPYALQG